MKDRVAKEDQTEEMNVQRGEMIEEAVVTDDLPVVETDDQVVLLAAVEEDNQKKISIKN